MQNNLETHEGNSLALYIGMIEYPPGPFFFLARRPCIILAISCVVGLLILPISCAKYFWSFSSICKWLEISSTCTATAQNSFLLCSHMGSMASLRRLLYTDCLQIWNLSPQAFWSLCDCSDWNHELIGGIFYIALLNTFLHVLSHIYCYYNLWSERRGQFFCPHPLAWSQMSKLPLSQSQSCAWTEIPRYFRKFAAK